MRLAVWLAVVLASLARSREEEGGGGALTHSCVEYERRVFVSTVDGELSAVDASGSTVWVHTLSSPLLSSTLNTANGPRLIPGVDRHLYQWDGSRLMRLPVLAEDLLRDAFPFSDGSSLVGAKVKEVTGVNIQSGKKLYECTAWECRRYGNQSKISRMDVLKLQLQSVTVREVEEIDGEELWNFTVGDLSLSLVEGEDEGEVSCMTGEPDWLVQLDSMTGVLVAASSSTGERVWEKKFLSPVVGVWVQEGGKSERATVGAVVPPSLHLERRPSLMLIGHESQQFVQPLPGILSDKGPLIEGTLSVSAILAQSYSAAVVEGERGLVPYLSGELDQHWCPSSNGVVAYFFAETDVSDLPCVPLESEALPGAEEEEEEEGGGRRLLRLAVGVAKYLLFALFVLGLERTHRKLRSHRSRQASEASQDEECMLQPEPASPLAPPPELEKRSNSIDSRFGSDYDLRGCLGKGGFGVVYHVQNKVDGGEYAIKRIKLPSQKPAREKVMREVQALAQLDHPNIVRYFHSWVEQAPTGWTEQEEWVPLSRQLSCASTEQSLPTSISPLPPRPSSSAAGLTGFSSCPSFSSLNHSAIHSELPPALTTHSRSSSFVVEFREEGEGACFSRELLFSRDNFSSSSSGGESTGDCAQERRDLLSAAEPPTYLFIQMQLCRKESLRDWLRDHVHNRPRALTVNYFEQMLDAVLYVHRKGMMHRDLKPSNIFFSLEGSIKVGDFGLVASNGPPSPSQLEKGPEQDPRHTGNIGSLLYVSPEQVQGRCYDQKVDIFSLGVIFFELHYPFVTEMERVKVLKDLHQQKQPSKFRSTLSEEAEFVTWLTSPLVSERPSADEVDSRFQLQWARNSAMSGAGTVPKL